MTEDGKPTNEGDGTGKGDNSDVPVIEDNKDSGKVDNNSNGENPLDRAERLNKEKAELLSREDALLTRREKLLAEEKVGGRAKAGTPQTPEEIKEAAHQARVKQIGQATGAQWAKD